MNKTALFALGLVSCLGSLAQAQAQVEQAKPDEKVVAPQTALPPLTPNNVLSQIHPFINVKVPRVLDANEVQLVVEQIENSDLYNAGLAARFLANAGLNADDAERLAPILARFKQQMDTPQPIANIPLLMVSAESAALQQFLLAFAQIENPKLVTAELQKLRRTANTPYSRKWLTAAVGFMGEAEVTPQLQTYLEEEKDGSLRALLIKAYARSAKAAAIPTLKKYLSDQTVTGTDCTGEIYGVRSAAQEELRKLDVKVSVASRAPWGYKVP